MRSNLKRGITALLAVVLLAAAPCTSAFGAQTYYVNDGDSTLTLADAYAIGAGDAAKLPERGVYAATAKRHTAARRHANMKMSSRTFQTESSARVWRSARRHWMLCICRSRRAPASRLGIMIPTACSGLSVLRVRVLLPSLRIRTLRLGTAPLALIMSSSVPPMQALMRRGRRPMTAAAIRCSITELTMSVSAAIRPWMRRQIRRRRPMVPLSPAAHAACWS